MVLQGTTNEVEGTEQAEEQAESTQTEKKPTGKTYTEEDFQRAVSKGLESTQTQLDLRKAEAEKYKAEAAKLELSQKHSQSYIDSLKKEMEKLSSSVDDEELRKAYTSSIASIEREMKIAEREAEVEKKLYDAEMLAWSARMAQKAQELARDYGMDIKDFEDCNTEEEMIDKAKDHKIEQLTKKPEEEPEKPSKFAGAGGGGGGADWKQLPAQQRIDYGLKHMKK